MAGKKQSATYDDYVKVVRQEMKKRGWSQEDLASALGVANSVVHDFLTGKVRKQSTIDAHVRKIAAAFALNQDEFEQRARYIDFHGLPSAYACVEFGKTKSLWWRAVGTGVRGEDIDPTDIQLTYDPSETIELPTRVELARIKALDEKKKGRLKFENGDILAIKDAQFFPPKGVDEVDWLELRMIRSEFANFIALIETDIGRVCLREMMEAWTPSTCVQTVIAQNVGISVSVLSSDNKFMFGIRSSAQASRKGYPDVGAAEALSIKKDAEPPTESGRRDLNVIAIGRRALREEYGIRAEEVVDMKVLGFGYDLQYAQWSILATARTSISSGNIAERQKRDAAHSAEYSEVHAIDANPESVFEWMTKHRMWSTGLAAAYYAMVHYCGSKATDSAIRNMEFQLPEFNW